MKKILLLLLVICSINCGAQYYNGFPLLLTKYVATAAATVNTTPQNLITKSEEFNDASWSKVSSTTITADQIVAPDGTTTADMVNAAAVSSSGMVRKTFTYTAQQYTHSVYIKKNNWDYVGVRIPGTGTGSSYPYINLSTGATNALTSGATMTVETLANGWFRLSVTLNAGAGSGALDIAMVTSTGSSTSTMTGTEKVYLWGAQISTGGPRIYSKTTTATIP